MTTHIILGYHTNNFLSIMTDNNKDEFYMVFDSNSSLLLHRDNTPSNFVISWENQIQLNPLDNWHVALTDLTYNNYSATISSNYAIKYSHFVETTHTAVADLTHMKKHGDDSSSFILTPKSGVIDEIELGIANDRLFFRSKKPFNIAKVTRQCRELGFFKNNGLKCSPNAERLDDDNDDGFYYLISDRSLDNFETQFEANLKETPHKRPSGRGKPEGVSNTKNEWEYIMKDFTFNLIEYVPFTEIFTFPEEKLFTKATQLALYLSATCVEIFQNVKFEKNKIQFKFQKFVNEIELLYGLNMVLGFNNTKFTTIEPNPPSDDFLQVEKADNSPMLNFALQNMQIFASICKPMYVGSSLLPLLSNVDIPVEDKTLKHGEYSENYEPFNPMYVPVATTCFSRIEIYIRNNSGQLLSFPPGAKTAITLHFRKHKHM